MTLNKVIEAVKSVLTMARNNSSHPATERYYNTALSTLPAKPMSEEEIFHLIVNTYYCSDTEKLKNVFRALRDAGVLYVEEKE